MLLDDIQDMERSKVSIIVDDADRFYSQIGHGESLVAKGSDFFEHQIFISKSPLQLELLHMIPIRLIGTTLAGSMANIFREHNFDWENPYFREILLMARLADSEYMLVNIEQKFPIPLTVSNNSNIAMSEAMMIKQLLARTSKELKEVEQDIVIDGKSTKHRFDLTFTKNGEVYLINHKRVDPKDPRSQISCAANWVFPTIDVNSHYKFVFVYSGDLTSGALRILQHYYDIVLHLDKFKQFLIEDLDSNSSTVS
jgi:hypothetical protein